MNTTKITDSAIENLKVASLPTRPTAPAAFGGRGYTASEMKAAFDRLPLYIIARFNSLLDDLVGEEEGSLAASLPTGIREGQSLAGLFSDLKSGEISSYLPVGKTTLAATLAALGEDCAEATAFLDAYRTGLVLDAGSAADRESGVSA